MSYNLVDPTTGDLTRVAGGNSINDETTSTNTTWSSEKINDSLDGKADKNAVLNYLELKNGYTTAQIIPWSDGTHYRSFEDKSSDTYTDIVTNNGIALITRTENGIQTKSEEIATMDKVESKYSEENVLTSTDWNTLNTKARYYFSGGTPMTNSPEKVPFGFLEVINVDSYCRIQRYFAFNGKLYIRRWSGDNWNEWYRFDGIAI